MHYVITHYYICLSHKCENRDIIESSTTKEEFKMKIRLDAFCIDDEFEVVILKDFDVRIADRVDIPYNVEFCGTIENLTKMVHQHWGMEVEDTDFYD